MFAKSLGPVSYWKQNPALLVGGVIVALFVMLIALQGSKLFVLDEMDFPSVAQTTSHTLRPVWYKGELTNQQSGLFHPPLYIYSLATFIRAFGFSEMTVRLFGMLCVLASSFLLINMLRLFNFKNRWGEVLFLGLFLLNPYTLACATVPDIDTTIMPVTLLLFLYVALRYYWHRSLDEKHAILTLSALFALNLWTKLTTPLMLPVFLFALLLICRRPWFEAVITTIKITLLGAAAFLVTYFIYTRLVDLPMSYTFTFLVQSFFKGTSGHQPLLQKVLNNINNIRSQVYWFTIPLTFVYVVSLLGLIIRRKFDQATKVMLLLSGFALIIFIFYQCLISPFGGFLKYQFPIVGLMILTIVFYVQTALPKVKFNVYYAGAILAAAFVYSARYVQDKAFLHHSLFSSFLLLAVAIVVGYVLLTHHATAKPAKLVFIYLLFVVIGYQLGISRIQAIAPYPTKYLYGQQGMSATISYLKEHTQPNEVIWSMKDVGFYVNDHYYESYPFYFNQSLQPQLINMLEQGKIRYYVATTGIGEDNINYYKPIGTILQEHATQVASFGDFAIYRSNSAAVN